MKKDSKGKWTDNTRNAKIKGGSIEVFKILNGYENILLHLFPLLCGVDVSCETPSSRPVLRVLL